MSGQQVAQDFDSGVCVQGDQISGGRGRSLHATRAFRPGEEVAAFSEALVVIPSGPTAKSICSQCMMPRRPAKPCSGCRAIAYCGIACQKVHWAAVHKLECRAFKRVRSKVSQDWLPTQVRAAVQLLLRWGEEGVAGAVDRLQGNVEAFRTKKIWADIELQALAVCTYAGWNTTDENLALASTLLCKVRRPFQSNPKAARALTSETKIQTNSFDRNDGDTGDTGTFLHPTLAMANHSCIPTALVAFAGRRAYLRAVTPIKTGDEITISYIGKPVRPSYPDRLAN